ncbi:MAG: energy transducer TonB [Pedobacter sp.]|nr:energy transducer TonB [Chitinophagaceae bacterium]
MQTQHILSANILDILFDGRNKNYGAYDLRKNYNKRIAYALSGTFIICLLFTMGSIMANGKKTKPVMKIIELTLDAYKKIDKPVIEKPKEMPQKQQRAIEQIAVTIPMIKPDVEVEIEDEMKPVAELDNIKIGGSNVVGDKLDDSIVAPPINAKTNGDGNVKAIEPDYTTVFAHVEVVAQFPGGLDAWKKYLERNLNAGLPAENGATSGKYSVIVSFVVDNEGNISEVKAENAPGFGTEAEAIRIIKKGPKWQPAIQNGRKVAYRVKQQVTFQVDDNG